MDDTSRSQKIIAGSRIPPSGHSCCITIDQIENIYWGLVGAYEDERAKEGALQAIDPAALR